MNTVDELAQAWYERQPQRLDWELKCFENFGLPAEEHTGTAVSGRPAEKCFQSELTFRGKAVPITISFPLYDYPDAPPMFWAPPGVLDRHQTPDGRNLCWSADPDRDWWPGMSAAEIVHSSIRKLFSDSEGGDQQVRLGEADMPEPVTGFIRFVDLPVIVTEPHLALVLPADRGSMNLLRGDGHLFLSNASGLAAVDDGLRMAFIPNGNREPVGDWVALSTTPSVNLFNDLPERKIETLAPDLVSRLAAKARASRSKSASGWLGLTFLEEGPTRGDIRRNWVFGAVEYRHTHGVTKTDWLQAQALARAERQRRTPELVGLHEASVLVVGAGSVGCPLTFELAKAGVGLIQLVDGDRFDVNNSVRHGLGVRFAGHLKAESVAEAACELNPFVTVKAHSTKLDGSVATWLSGLIAEASLIVDTTGSNSVARLLQRLCLNLDRPLIVSGLTSGSHGATIRLSAPDGPCFDCFLLYESDRAIEPPRAAAATALVTPIGCSHPAFSGAGFEATQLAANLARVVVQTTSASTYPPAGYNWAVMNFREAPRWRSGTATRHPHCHRHP